MPAVVDEGGHMDLISERGCRNITQPFLSVDDFFHTSIPRAVRLAEMNFMLTIDSNVKELILISSYINEAEFYPFLCLNWRPTSAALARVLLVCRHGCTKLVVLDAWHRLSICGPIPSYSIPAPQPYKLAE